MIRVGCAFRAGLIRFLWDQGDLVEVFEHSVDGFVGGGEAGLRSAATSAEMSPFCLHSIGLSLGSPGARERPEHLDEVRAVLQVMEADELSDHFSYTRVDGRRLHDFVPLWRVEEQLQLFVENVEWVQDRIGVRLTLENIAALFDPGGDMTNADFANEVSRRTGCALLLDISNVLIDEANGFCNAAAEFDAYDLRKVVQVHLAGGEWAGGLLWDAHSSPLGVTDLEWLERLLPAMPNCETVIIERDERLHDGKELIDDLRAVHGVVDRVAAARALA